jgi:NTP pyrophosphatase (non-canonical NTP hydrolase)
MTNTEYRKFVQEYNQAGFYATCLGLAGEMGELLELIKKREFHGKSISKDRIKDESGDLLFYLTGLLIEEDLSIEEIMDFNTSKLQTRYPRGFKKG